MQKLDHPNILKVYEAKIDGLLTSARSGKTIKIAYVVTEYVPNGELLTHVNNSPFSDRLSRYYIKQILSALKHMQDRGMAHRDLKLDNIALDRDFNVKILDFGMARDIAGDDLSGQVRSYVGTAMYMSPEIEKGE